MRLNELKRGLLRKEAPVIIVYKALCEPAPSIGHARIDLLRIVHKRSRFVIGSRCFKAVSELFHNDVGLIHHRHIK